MSEKVKEKILTAVERANKVDALVILVFNGGNEIIGKVLYRDEERVKDMIFKREQEIANPNGHGGVVKGPYDEWIYDIPERSINCVAVAPKSMKHRRNK